MKKWYVILIFLLATSCSSSDGMSDLDDPQDMEMMMEESEVKGNFVSDAHETTGTASLNETKTILIFTDFKTDDGPLLEVYLATDNTAAEYISLGELKGIEGDFQYNIPDGTDLEKLNYVVIWCVDFSVSFGHAILE